MRLSISLLIALTTASAAAFAIFRLQGTATLAVVAWAYVMCVGLLPQLAGQERIALTVVLAAALVAAASVFQFYEQPVNVTTADDAWVASIWPRFWAAVAAFLLVIGAGIPPCIGLGRQSMTIKDVLRIQNERRRRRRTAAGEPPRDSPPE